MEGGVGWRRMGRRGWDNVGRRDGRTEGDSTARSLWRDLEASGGQVENGPSKEQVAGPPPLPAQLPRPEEELAALAGCGQHGSTQRGTSLPLTLLREGASEGLVSWHRGGASKNILAITSAVSDSQ